MAAAKNRFFGIVKYVLLFGAAALLVFLAFRKVEWSAFWSGLKQTRWIWIVVFCLASVVALVGRAMRWKALLNAFDKEVSLKKVWDANNAGNLASAALPGTGEFLRCGYVTSRHLEFDKALGTVLCERIWDFIAIVVLAAVTLLIQWDQFGGYFKENILMPMAAAGIWWILLAVLIAAAVFLFLVFRFRGRSKFCDMVAGSVTRLGAGIMAFNKTEKKARVALTTFLIWFTYVLMCFCVIKAMPSLEGLSLADAAFLSLVGNVASVIPVPGGIGAYHYLVAAAVGLYGHSWDTGILFATLNHETHAVLIILLGIISYVVLVRNSASRKTDVNQ